MADRYNDIYIYYRNTPKTGFGEVYICNMKGKAARHAAVRLNGATAFLVEEKTNTKRQITPLENLNMRWIDKHTVAFCIPFGRWEIGLTEYSEGSTDSPGRAYSDEVHSNNISFEIGPSNPKAYFKHKIGWVGPVLKQTEPFDI